MISNNASAIKDRVLRHKHNLLLVVLAILALALHWLITPDGVGVGHDSIFYLDTAENLAQGRGVYWTGSGGVLKPLTHFPPLYPLLLAVPILLGADPITAARILASLTLGINVYLIGYILYRYTRNSIISLLGILTIMGSAVILRLQVWAMSEPLFFVWMLLSFFFTTRLAFTNDGRFVWLSAVCIALASLTRYVGMAILMSSLAGFLLLSKTSFTRRIETSFKIILIASAPVGLWLFRNWRLTGAATNRTFRVHLIDVDTIRTLLDIIFEWFTSLYLSHWVEGVILLLFFAGSLGYLVWRNRKRIGDRQEAHSLALIILLFIVFFLLQLLNSLSFFDASTRIDDRILAPIFVSLWLLLILLFFSGSTYQSKMILSLVFLALFILGPGENNWKSMKEISRDLRTEGYGFNSRSWRESDLIQWIRDQPNGTIIITNQSGAVRFLSDVEAIQLPENWDPVQDIGRNEYEVEIEEVFAVLRAPNSYLVMFSQRDLSQQYEIDWLDGFHQLYQSDDGIIYSWGQ
jgi:hypothetical protein